MERKLAAILAADVAGYSRLMGVDEEGTLNALRSHREVVDGLIVAHRGRVFNSAGDSVVAEFPSAVEAINCAVEIQQEMDERNEAVPKDKRLQFRIGLNIGDVMAEGGDLFGDGVNVAARLQELAEPGGICVARNVYNQVKHKVGVAFESLGPHHVKNIAEPVSVYRALIDGTRARSRVRVQLTNLWQQRTTRITLLLFLLLLLAAGGLAGWYFYGRPTELPAASTADSAIGVPVILVLPFQNLTGDPAQNNLGVGITEDLRDMLWNFPEFQVVSGTSSIVTGYSPANLAELAHKFGAQFVIEGSVRQTGDKAVITAQLIDGTTDTHLWSTRFEEASADPVALEKAAADKLSDSLGGMTGKMREAYERIAWSKPEAELTEYDYYIRGHTHHMRFTDEEMIRARDVYVAGLKRFPDSALLRIKVAWTYFHFVWNGLSKEAPANLGQAQKLVTEAAGLLATSRKSRFEEYYLHWISANAYQANRDFGRCIAEARAAVALTPYDPWVRGSLVYNMAECGSPQEAIEWAKESIRREPDGPPHSPENYTRALAWASYLAGRYQDAVSVIESMNNKPPLILAASQLRLGQLEQARSTMAAFVKDNPDWTLTEEAAIPIPIIDPLQQRWLDDLRAAGLPEK